MPDDIDFKHAMSGVRRLHSKDQADVKTNKPGIHIRPVEFELSDDSAEFTGASENEACASQLYFARAGIQGRALRDLKQGHHFHSDSVLDLHGYRLNHAEKTLRNFLLDALDRGTRHLLIIHGKGLHTIGGQSTLKAFCADWLKHHSEVLAYCSAQNQDGGSGAMYVLLKRRKPT